MHEESAVAAGTPPDHRVRKMSGVRTSTALLVGGALCALLLLLGGCSESNSNNTCNTGAAGGDCDGDGVLNGADAFPSNACAAADSDGDGHPDTLAAEDATVGTTTCAAAKRDDLTLDNCTNIYNPDQKDENTLLASDGLGDACDTDIDDDNDGLIEMYSLEDLDFVRHNLAGTSRKPGASASPSTSGAPDSVTGTACADVTPSPANNLCGYELMRDLDFSDATSYRSDTVNAVWTGDTGWTPIGDDGNRFIAMFDGNDNTITNLLIARDDTDIGLFGVIGSDGAVRHLALNAVRVEYTGNATSDVGALAGEVGSGGRIVAVSATGGSVDGGDDVTTLNRRIGGLVGYNSEGLIIASYAGISVDGGESADGNIGGLVGQNNMGTIIASYATGDVDGGGGTGDQVGGLVGANVNSSVSITASYATGNVDGGDGPSGDAGGLVGRGFLGTITASYATGVVNGGGGATDDAGGLMGRNNQGTITASYAIGNAIAESVGQLVGSVNAGTITASYGFGHRNGHRTYRTCRSGDGDNAYRGECGCQLDYNAHTGLEFRYYQSASGSAMGYQSQRQHILLRRNLAPDRRGVRRHHHRTEQNEQIVKIICPSDWFCYAAYPCAAYPLTLPLR